MRKVTRTIYLPFKNGRNVVTLRENGKERVLKRNAPGKLSDNPTEKDLETSVKILANQFDAQSQAASAQVPEAVEYWRNDRLPEALMIMDRVRGFSLETLLPKLSEEQVFRILAETAEALQYLHSVGVQHCHLTPGRILVPHNGRPAQLIGFGGARRQGVDYFSQGLGVLYGTDDNKWAAPEQFLEEPSRETDSFRMAGTILAVLAARVYNVPVRWLSINKKVSPMVDHEVRDDVHWWAVRTDGIYHVFKTLPEKPVELERVVTGGLLGNNLQRSRPTMDDYIQVLRSLQRHYATRKGALFGR